MSARTRRRSRAVVLGAGLEITSPVPLADLLTEGRLFPAEDRALHPVPRTSRRR